MPSSGTTTQIAMNTHQPCGVCGITSSTSPA
jgi:hypothetical protein